MGMSTHVKGFKAPDEKWRAMKAIWDACKAAGIKQPDEVGKFFNWEPPDDAGVEVNLEKTACCREWRREMQEGFEVDVKALPADVTHVRFYNSY